MLKIRIGIEIRGSTGQQLFPKKSYGLEVWDEKGNAIDTTFFGMPKESDWILYAPYTDKSLIHNNLTMVLAREMGIYGSRTQYVELFINDDYQGIYVLMEKVKRAKGRVDIAKLKETDIKGDALTGGYIIKLDKSTGTNEGGWTSKYKVSGKDIFYQYDYPSGIVTEQKNYIHAYVDSLEDALKSANFLDAKLGYRKFLDTKSFVKYFIISELAKNVDGYRLSTYFYKDKYSKGGKLKAGPPWDYDISYGNANYYEAWLYSGFAYKFDEISGTETDTWQVPFWWKRFFDDISFANEVKTEYAFQRKEGALTNQNIKLHIDSLVMEVTEAQVRNYPKWPILGQYIWPEPKPIPTSWEAEISGLRSWIELRLAWLDNHIPELGIITANEKEEINEFLVYPNPISDTFLVKFQAKKDQQAVLKIFELSGKLIQQRYIQVTVGNNLYEVQNIDNQLLNSIGILKIELDSGVLTKKISTK